MSAGPIDELRSRTPIVIATGNPHKVEEIRAILGPLGIGAISLSELPASGVPIREPAETGRTLMDNATIKALSYAEQTGRVVLADDSGLEVEALGGAPGVISSHYSSDGRELGHDRATRDGLNNERLLRELVGVPAASRGARFVCQLVVASPGRVLLSARGVCMGRIGERPRVPAGEHGFGYDPVFLVGPGHERTSAELSPGEKNAISHRAAALRELVGLLRARGA